MMHTCMPKYNSEIITATDKIIKSNEHCSIYG